MNNILKRFLFLFLAVLGFSFTALAQSGGTISGKLIDGETQQAVSLANIRVLKQSDSTFIAGKASDDKGVFSISVPNRGAYIVHISFIGYNDVYQNVNITNSNRNVKLGDIELSSDNILLSETVVTAKAAEIVVRGDTLEYNADSYKVTESAVVEDLLKKMPGVEIDNNGKITVNGREVKRIMVDGEEFFSTDPKVASKNLPAKMVDKLQVVDRKTEIAQMTGFDDGEEETIINLTVRPGMKEGLFGNSFAGYGSKERYEANAMVNYMKDKNQYSFLGGINNTNNAGFSDIASNTFGGMGGRGGRGGGGMFGGPSGIATSGNAGGNFSVQMNEKFKLGGNTRFGYTDNNTNSTEFTQNLLSSGNTLEDERSSSNSKSQNFNIDLRMEWEPDTNTTIIFRPEFGLYNNRRFETGDFLTTLEQIGDTINYGNSRYASDGNGNSMRFELNVSRNLNKPGRVISAQISTDMSDNKNTGSSISNTYYNGTRPDDLIDQQFTNTSKNNAWRGYISYVEPIGKNNYLQFAYNYRQNNSQSDRDTRSLDDAGRYTVLDSTYSRRLENSFVNQRIELNFRAVRAKYDYMLGVSVQPSSSKSNTFIGTRQIGDVKQEVVNYSPMAQLNYRWSRTHNLRLRYFGNTDQPSVSQLSPVVDVTDPLNIRYGNPNLKPSFNHRMFIRYQNSNPQKASSVTSFVNFGYVANDIVSSTVTDRSTGRKETTYKNVSGNWNANGRLMINRPLKNIKFSVFSMSFASYNHTNGFSNNEANLNRRVNLMQVLGLNYRSDVLDFGIRGNINYNTVKNSLKGQQNQEYFNYGTSANTTIYLPWNVSIESDISYRTNSGYADGYQQSEWLWNASVQKQLFKQKNGTLRFKIYDILQQRSNINRSVTSNYIRDTTTNTLTSYFMVHFIYRFNIFKGGATQSDMMPGRRGPGGFPGGGPPPGGGPGGPPPSGDSF